MKSQVLSTAVFAGLISQVSSSPLQKRAGEPIGYGAGTTGGAGGAVTTVTSCSALEAAVAGTGAKIVRINGMLSGCGIIDVDSNTSIL
jgi:pectate lyase